MISVRNRCTAFTNAMLCFAFAALTGEIFLAFSPIKNPGKHPCPFSLFPFLPCGCRQRPLSIRRKFRTFPPILLRINGFTAIAILFCMIESIALRHYHAENSARLTFVPGWRMSLDFKVLMQALCIRTFKR